MRKLLSLILLLTSSLPALAQFGAQAVAAGRWEPRNYVNGLGVQALYCTYWTNGITLNGSGASEWADRSFVTGRPENLLVQSETFSTTWTRARINNFGANDPDGVTYPSAGSGSFANTAYTTDPLGGNTADFIQEDGTAANNHRTQVSVGVLAAGTYTVSCVFKVAPSPSIRTWARLSLLDTSTYTTDGFDLYCDVSTGVNGSANNIGTGSGATANAVVNMGNGWYKFSVTGTTGASSDHSVRIDIAEANNDFTYSGDNTSGFFVWGAQLRSAASSPSSDYVATTTLGQTASRSLAQGTAASQPTYNADGPMGKPSLVFDGSNDSMSVACAAMVQPTVVIWGGRQVTWTDSDHVLNSPGDVVLAQRVVSPGFRLYAGTSLDYATGMALGQWGVITATLNGASSSITINKTIGVSGNAGTSPANGLNLGGKSVGQYANIETFGLIVMTNTSAAATNYARLGFLGMAGTK